MSHGTLEIGLQKFIAQYIESVEKLEILFFLYQNPGATSSGDEVFSHIQSSVTSVNEKLQHLCANGLAVRHPDGRFQYKPRNQDLALKVSALQADYRLRPTKVIEAIFSERSSDMRAFSEAFRFRKESE